MAKRKKLSGNIAEIVELTRRIAEQRKRGASRTAALQAARDKIREFDQFVPKQAGTTDQVKICF
jgi:hypothetical protein